MSSLSGKKRDRSETVQGDAEASSRQDKRKERKNEFSREDNMVGHTIAFDRVKIQQQSQQGTKSDTAVNVVPSSADSDGKPAAKENASATTSDELPQQDMTDQTGSSSFPTIEQQNSQIVQHLLEQMSSIPNISTNQEGSQAEILQAAAQFHSLLQQHQQQLQAPPPVPQFVSQLQQPQQQGQQDMALKQLFSMLTSGNQPGDMQMQLLQAILQQQAQLQQPLPGPATNQMSNVLLQTVLSALPQLSSLPVELQQGLFSAVQQHLHEQQRNQQEHQQQIAVLMALLLQQQPQSHGNALAQIGTLQQILALASANSMPSTQDGLSPAMLQLLAVASQLGNGMAQFLPQPISASTSTSQSVTDPNVLLQLLATTSPQLSQLAATAATAAVQNPATVAQGVTEISGSSDVSTDQCNMNQSTISTSVTSVKRNANTGRPSDAFSNRDPDGRARDLPTLLVMPTDLVELSSHQTLLRYQIEVFRAGKEDVATHTRGRNKKVELGQIGIRCRHCKVLPVADRLRGSVYFPRAIEGFYQAAQNMNSTHLQTGECQMMGEELRQEFADLVSARGVNSTGAGRAYWVQQARSLGLENTEDGIRFYTDPPKGNNRKVKSK